MSSAAMNDVRIRAYKTEDRPGLLDLVRELQATQLAHYDRMKSPTNSGRPRPLSSPRSLGSVEVLSQAETFGLRTPEVKPDDDSFVSEELKKLRLNPALLSNRLLNVKPVELPESQAGPNEEPLQVQIDMFDE